MESKRGIPESLKHEHDNVRASLAAATAEPGALGEAARNLARVLQPHLDREEQLVYPALACLPDAVNGRLAQNAVVAAQAAQPLRQAMPEMLAEHQAIRDALEKLRGAAAAASRPAFERFADSLMEHLETEEEVLFLAAILVGEYAAACLERQRASGGAGMPPPPQTRPR